MLSIILLFIIFVFQTFTSECMKLTDKMLRLLVESDSCWVSVLNTFHVLLLLWLLQFELMKNKSVL